MLSLLILAAEALSFTLLVAWVSLPRHGGGDEDDGGPLADSIPA